MKSKPLHFLGLWLFVLFAGVYFPANAQITINTTTGSSNYTGANNSGTNGFITFVLENTSATDILLTDVGNWSSSATNGTTSTLWYSTTSLSGPVGTLGAPDWTTVASNTVSGIASATLGVNNVISGMSFLIPAGAQYRFALQTTGTNYYSGAAGPPSPSTFSSSGVDLEVGDYQIAGQNVGYGVTNNPRWFTGSVTFIPATACAGTPTPGVASGPASVCPGTSFTLTSSGVTVGTGVVYQWEESPAGAGTFGAIAGATSSSYTVTSGISTAMDYQLTVTCNNGGASDVSNIASVGINSFLSCYCTSSALYTADEDILGVTFGGINNTSVCGAAGPAPNSVASLYSDYTATVPAAVVAQGDAVPFVLDLGTCGTGNYNNGVKIFIDYNQNGLFTDPGEEAYVSATSTSGAHQETGIITIDPLAVSGTTRMRVVQVETGTPSSISPCGTYGYGETEDYLVDIVVPTPCGGSPVAGTATASTGSICPGSSFNLSAAGYTAGQSGISFQWEESASGASSFAPISGATNAFYTVTGQAADMDYHMVVTCTNGGSTDVTNDVTVTMNSFLNCYCTSAALYTADEDILGVTFGGINNTSACGAAGPAPNSVASLYSDFTGTVAAATVAQGDVVPFILDLGTCGTGNYNNGAKIFIDYNQNGLFTDPGEEVYVSASATSGAHQETGSITIPAAATPGTTRMRVVQMETGTPSGINPCGTYGYGETEDYLVDIVVPTPCSGSPIAGTASSSAPGICTGSSFNLSSAGYSAGQSGISFQWEESPSGAGSFLAIFGATNPFYTVTGQTSDMDYHLVVTCANGGSTDVSNDVTVVMNSFLNCYCASGATYPFDGEITNVTVGPMNNSSVCSSSNQLYTDYTTSVPAVSLMQTQAVPISVTAGSCGGSYAAYVKIFIDYDQDGTFTGSGEEVYAGIPPGGLYTPAGVAATGSFIVPVTATAGTTRMRVILDQTTNAADVVPCGIYNYGETEDYLVDITPATACSGSPVAGTASGPSNICPSTSFTLNATGFTNGTGISYQWEESPGGAASFTAIAGATDPFYIVASGITSDMDYHMMVTCANGGASDMTNDVSVTVNSFLNCYCTSHATSTADEEILGVVFGGISSSSTCSTTGGPGSTASEYSDYTGILPAASVGQGVNAPFTVQVGTCGTGSYNNMTKIFIDYNQNGLFTDPGEEAYVSATYTSGAHTESGTIAVPMTATLGTTRMRVVTVETTSAGSVNPCGTYSWGETEDYLVDITLPPSCLSPGLPSITNILATTADASWGASSSAPANGYEWSVFPQGSGPAGTPVASGTSATAVTQASITGLSASTGYTFFVRALCSPTDMSAWTSINFTTACATFTAPFSESFNTTGNPLCWSNSGPESWLYSQGAGPGYGVAGSTDHTGNGGYFAWVDGSGTGTNQDITLLLPNIDISGLTSPQVKYFVKSFNADDAANNKLVVEVLDAGVWVEIDSLQMNLPTNGWYSRTASLAGLSSSIIQLRFVVDESNAGGFAFYNDILLDDITVDNINPLSIKLSTISATNVGLQNRIDWTSATEDKGDYYEVERSIDGHSFTKISEVTAKGQASSYSFWDQMPVSGINYYRLKLMGASGENSYSKVVNATIRASGSFVVEAYPNPVIDGQLTVSAYGQQGTNAMVSICDVTGKVLKVTELNSSSVNISMSSMAAGVYLVKYSDSEHAQTIKINKQ